MISLHKTQLAIWILLYILNYTSSFEYGTIWTNFNNKQLCGVPPSAPWKAWQRLYYDNSNEIVGLKQLPYINRPRYGKVNITNFGNYETINNKHRTDLRDQIIENTKDNVLLSSRRKTFSLIGYDEEIYKIMQKFTMSGQTGPISVYFYLSQNHTYSRIGLLRTTPRMLDFILSKYNYFNCVNSNHIMIPRENNIFYADECLKDCDKLITKYMNLNDNDNMKSYVDYFANNCLNGKDNYQNNLVINNENNFNINDSPAINNLHLPQNNYKTKANPNIFLPHDSENINDRITYSKNILNENNKNNYADILNSDFVNKLLTDMNKNLIDKICYSDEPSPIRDNAQNVHSGLYYNYIPVREFMSHPSHLQSNEYKFKAHNNDNNFETIKNSADVQTTNTSPAENHNNAIILEGNFMKENLNTPEFNYDPISNNKIDRYISYGKNKNLKQIYNTKDDKRAVNNIPYNINYKSDGQLVFPDKSTSSEIFDTALANNQIEYLPSQKRLPKQYLNLPSIFEANYSIPRKLANYLTKPDTNFQKISSADATNENNKHLHYIEPRLFAANTQTFDSEILDSNPSLQYTFNPETSYNMQRYNFVETNESKASIDAKLSAIPYELKSPTRDAPKMNQYILSEKSPDLNTLTYINTPTALQRPGFYAQKELQNSKVVPSQGLNSNTFKQNLQKLPLLAYKEPVQVNYKKINSDYIPSVSYYTPYSFSKPHSVSPKEYSPTNFISPLKFNLKPWYETTQTTNKNSTKPKAITLDSSIVTPNSPRKQQHIFIKPRKQITKQSLNIPCSLVPIQLDKTYNPESNINDISMDGLLESKSKYFPRGDGKLHSLQTPFSTKYDESSPRHTNKENTPRFKFAQWKPVSSKVFIEPNFPYNVANHKNKATPFVTPSQVVYRTIPKTNDLIPLDVEYASNKIPSFDDSQKPNKVVSVLPKTDSTENYKTSVEIPKLPFKKALSPKKLYVIPPTYQSLLHKKAPTWVQKYQPVDGFLGQNVNQNLLITKNFKSDDNQEREPIIDSSKTTVGIPKHKVFNAPNAKTAKYYCPTYRYPSFCNMQNDNNSLTTTTASFTSRNTMPDGQNSLITEPQDKNNNEQSIFNGIASPCHLHPLSQTSKTYKPQFSEELKELTYQEAVSHTTEPQNKSNEEQSISNGIASPCYVPPLSQTSKIYKPHISEELKELTQQETIPRQNNQRNFKNLKLSLASSSSYKNPSLYVPSDFNVSPNPQLATLSTATNHPSTVVQNGPAVNFAQPLKILDKKEYFKSPNIEYYNSLSKVKAKPFITPLTPRVECLPPKITNMDLMNTAYFPIKINTICGKTAFNETPKLSDIDDTNNNLASVEVPKVPPRIYLNRDEIKNIKNTPSTRIDQHTPSWIKKYYHYPLQTPHNLPIQTNEQNNFEKPATPKQESNNIQEKEPSADLGKNINQPYPNENTVKYYSPLQRNPSFTDKPYSLIPKLNCIRYNMHQSQHQTPQNQYFPVIESQKETKSGLNRIAESYDFPMSQILQSYKPQSLEVPKVLKQNDELTPQSKTKVTEFELPQHQPDFQDVNFSEANGSSYRKPPLNPYNLKSMLRNVQPAKVPTATNQQSNLNFNQAKNVKELYSDNLYFQRNGQGLPNLANKGPVSSTPYIHKHPPFEYTNPMWTILPQTLSNNSLKPKQQIKFVPMENSLEPIKWYKNIPCYANGEYYKIQNPKLNYVKPFDYELNGYYPKISKQKGLQPCVGNTAEFYDPLILKPQTTSSQTEPTNLEPTIFSSPEKMWTQKLNHDLRTPEYFPTFSRAQIKYFHGPATKNVIPIKKPLVCGNNNKINYYTKPVNPNSIIKTIFTPNHQHRISVEEPTEHRNSAHRRESPIVYQPQYPIHEAFTKLSALNKPLHSLSRLVPSQFNEMPPQLMSAQKKISKHPINYSNKNINFINDIKEQTPSESTHVPCEIKDDHKFNFTDKHNKWPAKYLKSYAAPMGYSATALPCPVKNSPVFDQSSRKSTTALPFVSLAPSTIVSKKSQSQKSLASYHQIPQALIKLSSIAPTEKRKYNIRPPKDSQNLSTPRPIPSSSNPFMLTNIGKTAHPSIQNSFTKNTLQPKKFIQEPFSNLQQNPLYSSPISRNQERNINQVKDIVENYIAKKPVPYIRGESRTGGDKYHNIRNDSPCSLLHVPIPVNSYSPYSSSVISQKSWIPKTYPKSISKDKTKASPILIYNTIPTSAVAPIMNITPSLYTRPNLYKYIPFEDLKYSGDNHRIPTLPVAPITNITPSLETRSNPYKYTPFEDHKDSGDNHRIPNLPLAPIINITPSLKSNPYRYTPQKDLKDSGGNHRILASEENPITSIAPSLKTRPNPYQYTPTFKNLKDSDGNHRIPTSAVTPIINIIPCHKTRENPFKYMPKFKNMKYNGGNHRIPTLAENPIINIAPSLRTQSNPYKYTPTFNDHRDSSGNHRIPTSAVAPIINLMSSPKLRINPYKYTPTFKYHHNSGGDQRIPTSAVAPAINITPPLKTRPNPYKYTPTYYFEDQNIDSGGNIKIPNSAKAHILNIKPALKTLSNPYKYTPTFNDRKDSGNHRIPNSAKTPITNITPSLKAGSNLYKYTPLEDLKDSGSNHRIPTSAVAPITNKTPYLKSRPNPCKYTPTFKNLKDSNGNHRVPTSVVTPIINITPSHKTQPNPYKNTPTYFKYQKDGDGNIRIPTSGVTPIINMTPYKYTPFKDRKDCGGNLSSKPTTSAVAPYFEILLALKTRSNPYKYTAFKVLKDSSVNITLPLGTRSNPYYKYTPSFKDLKYSGGNHRIPTSAAAPIINITPSLKTRPNLFKYIPFEDLKDSGGDQRNLISAVSPVINIAPSLKTQPNPYKYTPTYYKDQKDDGRYFIIPTSTINMTPYKYTPFIDRKDSGDNHRVQTSAESPIINIAPSLKTRPNPYKYTPFEDLTYSGVNITPPLRTRPNPYKYTPFEDLKDSGVNITPPLGTLSNPYKYTPFEDLKDSGVNITPPLGTRSNPYYKYTPSFKDLKYSGGNHRIPTSAAAPIINIAPSLKARSNPYENTPTFKYLKDSDGNYRICTSAETPIMKMTPSSSLSKYTPTFKEPKGSGGNKRIGDLMNSATYMFQPYSPYPTRFYAPTPNIKPRKLSPTTVQPLQPIAQNIADFELQKPKLQEKPVSYSAPLYKIVNDNMIGNTVNNIKHTIPEEKTPCSVLNSSKNFELYNMKKPTKAATFSQNIPYSAQNSLKLINDKEKSSISSQIPAVFWAPQNILSPAQTVISKGTLQNGNVVPRLTENTSNLYETNAPLSKVLGSSYYIPQDNALTLNQPFIAVPPTIQSTGKILPLKQSPMQSVNNLFKNVAVHKNVDPVQNILYSYPMQGNQHNTKEFTDLRDNYVKPFKCTTCDCKVCERNPTILDQIMKQLYAYSKTMPDKFYESRAGFTNGNISIPFRDMGLAKYEVTKPNEFLKTEIPGLFIKAWGSRIKIIRPRLVLDVKEYEGYNFMPVIKNHYYSPEFAQNVAKDIVTRLYGEPIVIDGVYSPTSPYAVIDDINNALVNDGKAYILWPTLCNCGCMKSGCKCCFRN